MAGTQVSLTYDDTQVTRMLQGLMARCGDLTPAMRDIGEYMLRRTDDCFRDERDPQGRAWKPLSPVTLAMKKNDKILTEKGGLRGNIAYAAGRDSVTIGTGPAQSAYAAIHQFGGKAGPGHKVTIPARPYLEFTSDDMKECAEIVREHVTGGIGG
jgi:phage virion morphogenesis protein